MYKKPSPIRNRTNILKAFVDMDYSLKSQKVIADIMRDTDSEKKEERAKEILDLMNQMSEAEVLKVLNQLLLSQRRNSNTMNQMKITDQSEQNESQIYTISDTNSYLKLDGEEIRYEPDSTELQGILLPKSISISEEELR